MTEPSTGSGARAAPPQATPAEAAPASTGELVTRLSTQLSELVRSELELARTELAEKGKRAGLGAGLAGAGGVVALFGVGALVAAAITGLAVVLSVWLSALIVGVVLLAVAGGLALSGRNAIGKAVPPVPQRAVEGLHQDVDTVRSAAKR